METPTAPELHPDIKAAPLITVQVISEKIINQLADCSKVPGDQAEWLAYVESWNLVIYLEDGHLHGCRAHALFGGVKNMEETKAIWKRIRGLAQVFAK